MHGERSRLSVLTEGQGEGTVLRGGKEQWTVLGLFILSLPQMWPLLPNSPDLGPGYSILETQMLKFNPRNAREED